MNINHLQYFVEIIKSNYNLSVAADKLFVSQPALSNLINRFENTEKVTLFVRKNGRLVGLTNAGEILFNRSQAIIRDYQDMMAEIHELSHHFSGTIRIGIPPLVISVLFTELLSKLIRLNPNIRFEIIEFGAYRLIEEIEHNNIDIAIILHPNLVNLKTFNEVLLFEDEFSAFVNHKHPLAQKTNPITWPELAKGPLATFNKEYMIYHHMSNKFKEYNISPNISIESTSWDFLIAMVREANAISLLPSPSEKYTKMADIRNIPIEDSIPWKVSMIYPKKEHYSLLENYIIKHFQSYFTKKGEIRSIDDYEYQE